MRIKLLLFLCLNVSVTYLIAPLPWSIIEREAISERRARDNPPPKPTLVDHILNFIAKLMGEDIREEIPEEFSVRLTDPKYSQEAS